MPSLNLLYSDRIEIDENLYVRIPTIGEILGNQDLYYTLVHLLTAMPYDLMVMLDDMGIDFTTINDYDLFLLLFRAIAGLDTSLVFGDLDLSKFAPAQKEGADQIVLYDPENDIVIDRRKQQKIAMSLRMIHHLEKNKRKPGNEEAKKYLLERERKKKSRKKMEDNSGLESLIIAMVNTEQFKYNYETVKEMTIYQFNISVRQIIQKIEYEHTMHGVYAGTVNTDKLDKNKLNWLSQKD